MRIVHLADTHLGYSAYRKVTEQGVNQREMDVYDAFTRCIDYAIKTKPDLVLHAGDLFDSVRPSNRAITVAIQQILRLSKEKIPFVVISGNHETPKLKETGNIFTIFEHLDQVYPIHKNHYEAIFLKRKDETVCVHAVPQCQNPDEFDINLKKISVDKNADYNLLLAHGAVKGIKEFKMNEFNELFIPIKNLSQDFDYIALGHYHIHTKLEENAFYAGSTEHLSFTEADSQKGCLEIELGQKLRHRFIPLHTRTMIDVLPLDCSTLRIEQIVQKVKETIHGIEPKDKIIRLRLENIPAHIQRGIDYHQIRELGKTAVHFEVKTIPVKTDKTAAEEGYKIKSLADEFGKFLTTQQYPEEKMLLNLGLQYIQKVEEHGKKP
ncbi:MAG TPA: exonuclease SbcCD subunit D [Candidatus Thermoplasmatota archaeon]|nr:exonuclease SbcCD subunit D [Candidatus Thermoplasmatota archaeon]